MNCLKCKDPGHCCREFYLVDREFPNFCTIKESKKKVIARVKELGLPFRVVKKGINKWIFGCTKLSKKGLCKIHPTRPDLCRSYKAGTGLLCVHSKEYGECIKQNKPTELK